MNLAYVIVALGVSILLAKPTIKADELKKNSKAFEKQMINSSLDVAIIKHYTTHGVLPSELDDAFKEKFGFQEVDFEKEQITYKKIDDVTFSLVSTDARGREIVSMHSNMALPKNTSELSGFIEATGLYYIYVPDPIGAKITCNIVAPDGETNKLTNTQYMRFPINSTFNVVVEPEEGYNARGITPDYGKIIDQDIVLVAEDAELQMYNINVSNPKHASVRVIVDDFATKKSLVLTNGARHAVGYWSTFKVEVETEEGYVPVTPNIAKGTVKGTVDIIIPDAELKVFKFSTPEVPHQSVTAVIHDTKTGSEITVANGEYAVVGYGSTYTVSVKPEVGYDAGALNSYSGTVTGNVDIIAGPAILKEFPFVVNSVDNQLITVTIVNSKDGKTYVLSNGDKMNVGYGSTYTAVIKGNTGYNSGSLSSSSGTITQAVSVTASNASLKTYNVTVGNPANETITVTIVNKADGKTYTLTNGQSMTVGHFSTYSCKVTPNTGYNAGSLSSTSGTISGATSLTATDASLKMFKFTVGKKDYQNIKVSIINAKDGKTYTLESGQSMDVGYGSTYTATVASTNSNYNAGTVNSEIGTVYNNVEITATDAVLKTFSFTVGNTSNQNVTVKIQDTKTGTTITLGNGQSATVGSGSTYTSTVTANTGYNAGTLSSTSGTVTANTNITVTAAALKTFTFAVGTSAHQKITVSIVNKSDGKTYTLTSGGSMTVGYGSTWTATVAADTGYNVGTLKASSGTVTSAYTVEMSTGASLKYYKLTVPASSNQTYTLKLTANSTFGGTLPSYTSTATSSAQTLTVPHGCSYVITYSGNTGYNAGSQISGTVTGDKSITHNNASVKTFTVSVPAVTTGIASYSITITKGSLGSMPSGYTSGTAKTGVTAATSVTVPYGSTVKVDWTATTGYNLSKTTETGSSLTAAKSFANPTASVKTFTVSVPAVTTGIASYSITITKGSLGSMPSGYTSGTAKTGVTAATSVTVPYGSTVKVDWTATTGYNLSKTTETGSSLTAAKSFANPTASVKTFTVSVPAVTTGIASYSITITKGSLGSMPSGYTSGTAKTGVTAATSVTVPYGSTVKVDWTATTGYNLSKTTETGSSLTAAKSFANPTASVKTFTVSVPAVTTGIASYKITITKGSLGSMPSGYTSGTASAAKTAATSVTVPYGSTVKVDWTATTGYNLSKTTETGSSLTAAKSFANPTASVIYHTLTVGASTNQSYTVKLTKGSLGSLPSGWTSGSASSARSTATSVSVPYGTSYEVVYTASAATAQYTYTATAKKTGTITTSDVNVGANSATATTRSYTVACGATTNQSYRLLINGSDITGWRTAAYTSPAYNYGTTYKVEYSAAGATAQYTFTASGAVSGTITGAVSVGAKSATATTRSYTVACGATTNQSYRLLINGTDITGWRTAAYTSPAYNYGTTYKVEYSAAGATAQYTFTASGAVSGTITGAVNVGAKSATANLRWYTATIKPYSAQQGISFTCNGSTSVANGSAINVSVPYGYSWSAYACKSSTGASWDNYGGISASSGTVTGSFTISGTSSPYDYCSYCNNGCCGGETGAGCCGGEGCSGT